MNDSGSGCGSVGKATASNSRGPLFESRPNDIEHFTVNCIGKTKIKKKGPGMVHCLV